jgi:hypothetical protein
MSQPDEHAMDQSGEQYGSWNPGIQSVLPKELLALSTIFRPENVITSVPAALELQGLTGLSLSELVVFRAERLALHELLIRVTADFVVPDGSRVEDLGISFREMTGNLLTRHILPNLQSLIDVDAEARVRLAAAVNAAFDAVVPGLAAKPTDAERAPPKLFARRGAARKPQGVAALVRSWGPQQVDALIRMAAAPTDPLQEVACRALSRVMSALFSTQGCTWGGRELILSIANGIAGNAYCSDCIGAALEPLLRQGAIREGYGLLPRQERPVVINTKGPSASGKSTLRLLQRKLASDIGVDWRDIALISPDIWRKQLLDYGSLGPAYKYAGAFTGEEVQIVDQKLDRYMARKHRIGHMPHLLIDRFRFDSFAPGSDEAGSNLLTRFGQTVYLFFVITPPDLLVERAWKRGLEVGRYKAVDDTLAHSVEAYTGMPDVFFTWARRRDKRLQFEFLDNTVRLGDRPRTVAFGDSSTFNVLDVGGLLNIERYGRIDVDAQDPQSIYPSPQLLAPEKSCGFLGRCLKEFPNVNFADQGTGRIYLHLDGGRVSWIDREALHSACNDADVMGSVKTVAASALGAEARQVDAARYLSHHLGAPTLGEWGLGISRQVR